MPQPSGELANDRGPDKLGKRFAAARKTAPQPNVGLVVETDGDRWHRVTLYQSYCDAQKGVCQQAPFIAPAA
jgi:hypothetical protein